MDKYDTLVTFLGREPTEEEVAIFDDQQTRIEFGVFSHPLWDAQETATGLAARDPFAGQKVSA